MIDISFANHQFITRRVHIDSKIFLSLKREWYVDRLLSRKTLIKKIVVLETFNMDPEDTRQ